MMRKHRFATNGALSYRPMAHLLCGRLLFVVIMLLALAAARAAPTPQLSLPDGAPGRQGCAGARQIAQRIAVADGGARFLIEASYDQAHGSGQLSRRSLVGSDDGARAGAPLWEAASLLDGSGAVAAQPTPSQRRILTLSASGATVPFEWSSLDDGQRSALDVDGDGLGEARLAFVRGDRAREGAPFRRRTSVLGAIVRSTPLLVGAPAGTAGNASALAYATFYQRYRSRSSLFYVGAADGMLHAFDWNSGLEQFAYVPRALVAALPQLSDPDSAHLPGVDGAPGEGDAVLGGQWRSVLASGMGASARGLFALDVTDPIAGPQALWEFGERDDDAIGLITTPPQIVKLRSGGARGAPTYRYFALVSNGFNASQGNDGMLFLLALDKLAAAPWRRGENYFRLQAPARERGQVNALAAPALVFNADGSLHSAYAGDLQGTMWRFDLDRLDSGSDPGTGMALFHARAADGAVQPIGEAARVVFAPGGGVLVLFGTGRSIEAGDFDAASFVQQSFYAVRDKDVRPLIPVAGRAALVERRLVDAGTAGAVSIVGDRFDYNGSGAAVKHGWFIDFPRSTQDGERSAGTPMLSGTAVIIATLAPGSDRCTPHVASYLLDSVTGLTFDRRGLPASTIGTEPALTGRRSVSSDGMLPLLLASTAAASAPTPTGAVRIQQSIKVLGIRANGGADVLDQVVIASSAGRLSWREVANWREAHAAALAASSR